MSTPQAKTVPCKYKTGKTLGSGTYAVVKGILIALSQYD
jgi:hypothetical protein